MIFELSSHRALSPRSRPRISYLWQGGPMYETEADLARLQELIDASFTRSPVGRGPDGHRRAERGHRDGSRRAADQRPGRTFLARPVVRDHLGDVAESPTAAQPARDQRGLHAAGRVRRLLPRDGPVPATRIG